MKIALALALLVSVAAPAFSKSAQDLGLTIEPKQGQDMQTQKKDEQECLEASREDVKKNKSGLIRSAAKRVVSTPGKAVKKVAGRGKKKGDKSESDAAAQRESVTSCLEDRGYTVQLESKE